MANIALIELVLVRNPFLVVRFVSIFANTSPQLQPRNLLSKAVKLNCCGSLKAQMMSVVSQRSLMVLATSQTTPSGQAMQMHKASLLVMRTPMTRRFLVPYMVSSGDPLVE
jgi:hypothetical protein